MAASGSSESVSGGAGDAEGRTFGCAVGNRAAGCAVSRPVPSAVGFKVGASFVPCGSGLGVSSTVECLPVVQGGISRNSSNVNTRGLQHFQPVTKVVSTEVPIYVADSGATFLPLVEFWRARMVDAVFILVCEGLSTTLVDALLCHCNGAQAWSFGESKNCLCVELYVGGTVPARK